MLRILISFLVACGVVLFNACSKEVEEAEVIRPVRAIKVGDITGLSGRSFPGRARAAQEVDLSFRVAGPLIELPNDDAGHGVRHGAFAAGCVLDFDGCHHYVRPGIRHHPDHAAGAGVVCNPVSHSGRGDLGRSGPRKSKQDPAAV